MFSAVCKLAGAASEASRSYQECLDLTRAAAENLVSIAALLDHASVPGRSEFGKIPEGTAEIGVGLHNEPVRPLLCFFGTLLIINLGIFRMQASAVSAGFRFTDAQTAAGPFRRG